MDLITRFFDENNIFGKEREKSDFRTLLLYSSLFLCEKKLSLPLFHISLPPFSLALFSLNKKKKQSNAALLRVRRPPVGRRHPRPPLQQLLRAVVLVHDHLDEAEGVLPLLGLLERRVELALGPAAHGEERVRVAADRVAAVRVVHRLDEADVVPVGDDVVGACFFFSRERERRKGKKHVRIGKMRRKKKAQLACALSAFPGKKQNEKLKKKKILLIVKRIV